MPNITANWLSAAPQSRIGIVHFSDAFRIAKYSILNIASLFTKVDRFFAAFLLTGPEGEDFRRLGTAESQNNQIVRAVSYLREQYRERFSLAELAARVGMSQP